MEVVSIYGLMQIEREQFSIIAMDVVIVGVNTYDAFADT
jgi:hypothetical protein